MQFRPLGQTGLELSTLSFGASSLGQEFRDVDVNDAIRAVPTALDCGMNFIDTSPFYGRGMSEVLLGIALKDIPRDSYYLGTKLGRYDADHFDFSAQRVIESVDVSLHRLGLEYLDFCVCHDIEFRPMQQIVDETLPALRRLQEQGKVRFVGVSGYPLKQRGVGIMNAAPFSARLLTNAPLPSWHKATDEVRAICRQAAEFCSQQGVDIAQLALQFSLDHPDMTTCITGSANPGRIKQWVQWAEQPLDQQLLADVQKILEPIHNWFYIEGRAENNDPLPDETPAD